VRLERKPSAKAKETISDLCKKIKKFLYENKEGRIPRSRWIESDKTGAKVYIRKGCYVLDKEKLSCCFCFANIDIPQNLQKMGIFSSLLDFVIDNNPFEAIYVESVCNLNLVNYLVKRGFTIKSGDENYPEGTRSYYLMMANRLDLEHPLS
jgi:hypothetical protein